MYSILNSMVVENRVINYHDAVTLQCSPPDAIYLYTLKLLWKAYSINI